ncbi:MAG: hypothetical protein CL457_02240 [Acidimicrobiaceae bacterium]|nr:hypothetical protein [Acidimicrobiaceae bacterium]|tara:strand:+ start:1251 stop:1862 length:612 start_codon:yes stop_codon:yes gene_type:complete
MNCENVYAHIYFDRIPDPSERISDTNIISIDSVSDQAPLMTLRGVQEFEEQFQGIIWSTSPEPIGDVGLSVRKVTAWSYERGNNVGKYPGLKQVSLVSKKEDLSSEAFYKHYQRHIDIAREHHGMERYAQNTDIEYLYGQKSKRSVIDGISELWFTGTSDWFERFYLKESSQRIVREDTQKFINYQTTCSIMVSEMRVRRAEK